MADRIILQTQTLSEAFCCGVCHDAVAITETYAGELCYECTNPVCKKTVSIDCPEALTVRADVTLKLPIRRIPSRPVYIEVA